jgi:hypothetical protein
LTVIARVEPEVRAADVRGPSLANQVLINLDQKKQQT